MTEQDRADIERLVDDPRHGATNRAVLWLLDKASEWELIQEMPTLPTPEQTANAFTSFAKAWEDAGVKSGGDDSFSRRIAEQSMAKHRAEQEAEQTEAEAAIRQDERRRIAERLRELIASTSTSRAAYRLFDELAK